MLSRRHLVRHLSLLTLVTGVSLFGQAPSVTTLSPSSQTVTYGREVQLTATVSPASASGHVTFFDGSIYLGGSLVTSGSASLSTTSLTSGPHSIHANYLGDLSNGPSESSVATVSVKTNPGGAFSFTAGYELPGNYIQLAVADLNGDGKADLVGSGGNRSSVSIALGNGNGTFSAPTSISVSSQLNSVTTVVVSDLNLDGKPDIVVVGTSGLSVVLANSDGSYASLPYIATDQLAWVNVADLNGDGVPDIYAQSANAPEFYVLLGAGDGTFSSVEKYSLDATYGRPAVADFDMDGKVDVVMSNQNNVCFLKGNGDGTFRPCSDRQYGVSGYAFLSDVNGDGKPDIILSPIEGPDFSYSGIAVLTGVGDGTFNLASECPLPRSQLGGGAGYALFVVDVDGDGVNDLIAVSEDFTQIVFGNSDGTFTPGPVIPGAGPTTLAVADVNGDGIVDLATFGGFLFNTPIGQYAPTVLLKPNNATYTSGQPINLVASVRPPTATGSIAFLDITDWTNPKTLGTANLSDGTASLQVSNATPGSHVYIADYSGGLPANTSGAIYLVVNQATSVSLLAAPVAPSLGQPATLSASVSNSNTGQVTFYDGAADLGTVSVANGKASITTVSLAAGPQIISAVFNPASPGFAISSESITVNVTDNGGGALQASATYHTTGLPGSLVTYDVDGDGKLDLVFTVPALPGFEIMFGNGDGTFTKPYPEASSFIPGAIAYSGVELNEPSIYILDPQHAQLYEEGCMGERDRSFGCSVGNPLSVGTNPSAVTAGDFDHDGALDAAVANAGSNNVTVLFRQGGILQYPATIVAVGSNPQAIAAGDLNNDGIPDLVVANEGSGNVTVLLSNGDRTFKPAVDFVSGTAPVSVAIADFNVDGKADVVAANSGANSLAILLGNGDGSLAYTQTIALSGSPINVVTGDFNGDGKFDIAVLTSSGVYLIAGNGNGTFGAPASVSDTAGLTQLLAGAFAGDGRTDLAAISATESGIEILSNAAGSTTSLSITQSPVLYGSSVTFTATVSPVTAGIVSFFDGSTLLGGASIVGTAASFRTSLLAPGPHRISARFLGRGGFISSVSAKQPLSITTLPSGGFSVGQSFPIYNSAGWMFVTDLNHDGNADVLTAPVAFLGTGNGGFQVSTTAVGGEVPVDLNNDGIIDFVTLGPNALTVALGESNGSFQPAVNIPLPQYSLAGGAVAVGDLNQDGIPDVVGANGNLLVVFLGIGDGTFQPPLSTTFANVPSSINIADLNGDGLPDVVLLNSATGVAAQVMLGRGDGTFQAAQSTGLSTQPVAFAVSDLNADGIPDLAVIDAGSATVEVLLGKGDGTFSAQTNLVAGTNPTAIAISDLNADGKPDIAVTNTSAESVSILFGNGDGSFQAASTIPLPYPPQFIAPICTNSNGTADLVVATTVPNQTSGTLLVIHGTPVFGILSGSPQVAQAGTAFGTALTVNAAPGAVVTFTAPSSGTGPSGTFAGGLQSAQVTVSANSIATAPAFTANAFPGSYQVTASSGSNSVTFNLTNSCYVVVSPTSIETDARGVSTSVAVNAPGCDWSVTSSSSWITVSPSGSSIGVSISPNSTGADRSGAISIGGLTVSVSQAFTTQQFADVTPVDYFFDAVNLLAAKSITAGCGNSDYCPGGTVTRDQMAIFIVRMILGTDNFTYSSSPYFSDVPSSDFAYQWIQKLYELGITSGCGTNPLTFCPGGLVTRDQMAIFLIRARYGATTVFDYTSAPLFLDIGGNFAFDWIQRLGEDQITAGCGNGDYCPSEPVTRGDMAIFVMRAGFNQLLPPAEPVILSVSPTVLPAGETTTVTVTGLNTHFVEDTTSVKLPLSPSPVVFNDTTLTFQVTPSASTAPISVWVATGAEEAVLPNALKVQ